VDVIRLILDYGPIPWTCSKALPPVAEGGQETRRAFAEHTLDRDASQHAVERPGVGADSSRELVAGQRPSASTSATPSRAARYTSCVPR
jgi:hypothetical protein